MKNCFKILTAFILVNFSLFCFADELIVEPDNGRAPLIEAIHHAKKTVNLTLYGFTDTNFMQSLADAKNNGKTVRILLEPHPYRANDENTKAIQFLQHADIPIHWPSEQFKFLHQKTFLLDNDNAIVMTFNLTRSTFKNERNFALRITDAAMVQEIQRVFNADWQQQQSFVSNPNLVWSPDNSRTKILDFIEQAQSDIKIYTQNIADYEVIGALAQAARSHVKVQILLSSMPTKKRLNYLRHAGVKVHKSDGYYIHAKVFIVDQKRAMVGSINLTKTSLDKNRELSVITYDKKIIQQLTDIFDQDFYS